MSSIKNVAAVSAKRRITGQGMTEYIIVVALIAIACIGAVNIFGDVVQVQFTNMSKKLMGGTGTQSVTVNDSTTKTLQNFGQ